MIKFQSSAQYDKDATVLILEKTQVKQKRLPKNINPETKQQIIDIFKSEQFTGCKCDVYPVVSSDGLLLLVGVGSKSETSLTKVRMCIKDALLSKYLSKKTNIEIIPNDTKDEYIIALIEGIKIGTYNWQKYVSNGKECVKPEDKTYTIVVPKKKVLENAVAICDGTNLARDLINDNADLTTATYLEKVVKKLVKGNKKVSLEILGKKEMKAKGLHLHLAVNQGSRQEPRLVIAKYTGASKKKGYTAIVGKGLTFDTGGLNLKPSGHIESMKLDMGGAGAVIGALHNTLALNLKKNVIFVFGFAENVTGSAAYKPGDVLNSYSGKTVEVANTDAEGRLVLADAISYTVKNYKPERIIDIATLTGACIVALGYNYSALVSTDDAFARQLVQSSNETDDRAWRLPCYPELNESVKSQIADIRNLGTPKGAGGSITAAEFLRQFTEDTKWAHLDIAGTSYVENSKRFYFGHGATGSGVRLLTHYIQNN